MATLFPFGKVVRFEVAGGLTEALDDFGIWDTIEHHVV
jgi:hypothetical protein